MTLPNISKSSSSWLVSRHQSSSRQLHLIGSTPKQHSITSPKPRTYFQSTTNYSKSQPSHSIFRSYKQQRFNVGNNNSRNGSSSNRINYLIHHRYTSTALLASSGNILIDHSILFYPSQNRLSTIRIVSSDDNDSEHTILCHSVAVAAIDEDDENMSWIEKVVQWIRNLWTKCNHAALLTLRGSEIILRMSPLLVLTPASIIAAQFIQPSSSVTTSDTDEFAPIRRMKTQLSVLEGSTKDVRSKRGMIQTDNIIADITWEYFTNAVTALGPAFVKLCQWVATRRDIFPPNVCNRLAHLHDRGTCHDWSHTHAALVEAFGPDYEKLGLHIEHDVHDKSAGVIGCGSAAQVYEGTITTIGTGKDGEGTKIPVAIKVLHPRFHQLVERDLWFLESIADLVDSLPSDRIKMLNLPRATRNFGAILQLQSDLRCEAANLNDFRTNFYGTGSEQESSIFFPKPIDHWISQQVLVEELVENAVPISEYLKDNSISGNMIRKELAVPLLNAFLKMVFLDNFVHCDLHPGNVLVRKYYVKRDDSSNLIWNFLKQARGVAAEYTSSLETVSQSNQWEMKRQIVFLDAGIAFQLEKSDQQNLLDLFRAVVTNNGKEAGRLMVERAKYERCSETPGGIEAFTNGIGEIVSEFHDRRKDGLTLGAVRIGSLLTRVLDLCRYHGVEIDPAMASVIVSTLVLEGLGRSLEPSLNLIDFALPFIIGRGRI